MKNILLVVALTLGLAACSTYTPPTAVTPTPTPVVTTPTTPAPVTYPVVLRRDGLVVTLTEKTTRIELADVNVPYVIRIRLADGTWSRLAPEHGLLLRADMPAVLITRGDYQLTARRADNGEWRTISLNP